MPKDPKKNVDRYKVRGGELNEFDFHQNQERYAEQVAAKSTKEKKAPTGASAKTLAARKAAKKK